MGNLFSDHKGITQIQEFKSRVLRRIYGPNMEEVTGEWRKQHNEKLHNLYASININRAIKLTE
jgi:hypothetical protein